MSEPWTPGPWTVLEIVGDRKRWGIFAGDEPLGTTTRTDADARLIAAAPEMAALLIELIGYVEGEGSKLYLGMIEFLMIEARDLLARIQGEAR